jgi:diguanylate cyclase (GGDEF)-like protein/PAS domain S-box-containing protein
MPEKPTYEELLRRVRLLEQAEIEREEAEKALRESEQRYKSLYSNMNEGVCLHELVYDENGIAIDYRIVDVNRAFESITNLTKKKVEGSLASEIYGTGEPPFLDIYSKVAETGQSITFEIYWPSMDKHLAISVFSPKEHTFATVFSDITERKRTEKALRESEEEYRNIYENAIEGFFQSTPEGRFISVNPAFASMLGYASPEELISNITDIAKQYYLDPEDRRRYQQILHKGGIVENFECRARRKDGSQIWVSDSTRAYFDSDGKVIRYEGIVIDITERKRAEETLRESEEKYRTVLEANPDPVVVYDIEGKVLYLNPAFTRVFGWSSKERFGKKMDVFVPEETWPETKMMIDKVLAGEAFSGIETYRYTKEGKLIPVSISGSIYRDLEGNHVGTVVNLRDISEQKSLEKKLERLSYLDGLTGVANRRQFDKNLELEWRRMARLDKSLSLIMCDIDFFKAYNDTYGHQAGDKCLKMVGNVLMGSAKRAGDLVARYGGEEFAILLPMTDAEKAFNIAEKIQRDINSLKVPHISSEVNGVVTLSFGIAAMFPQTSKSPNDLVELADKALYRAKHEGRNKVIIS